MLQEPGGFRHITVKDGLPSSEVYALLQDRQGFIWMSADAGVCRYNGYSFEVFTTRDGLADNTNFMLREDSRGRIWASGFSGAISYYDSLGFHGIPANDSLRKLMASGARFLHCFSIDKNDGLMIGGFSTNGWMSIPMAYSRTDPTELSGSFYNHGQFIAHPFRDNSGINSYLHRYSIAAGFEPAPCLYAF